MTADLEAECRRVLGAAPDAVERLAHSQVDSVTGSVLRVRADDRSAVVKVVAPRSADPRDASRRRSSFRYWRREAELLPSPVLGPYREAGIRPPALLAAIDRAPEVLALWQEAAEGSPGEAWTVDLFANAARRLGRAQGALSVAPADHRALSRAFLREYLAEKAVGIPYALLASDAAWAQPAIAAAFPTGAREALTRLHADQPRLLGWVEAGPRTLAHLDAWPHNLFAPFAPGNRERSGEAGDLAPGGESADRSTGDVVLVDWAFAGVGALGEDPGNLVLDAVFDLLHPSSMLPGLDRVVFGGYLAGLRDTGWQGDERWIRLAMCASAVKYDWLAPAMLRRAGEREQVGYGGTVVEDRERLFAERAATLAFATGWAAEARRLALELRLD